MLNSSDRIDVVRYQPDDKADWDNFLAGARSNYFIFRRDYMDYHADRFHDCSLLFKRSGRLLAIMPANIAGDTLHSHQGLTYGGIISDMGMGSALMLDAFRALIGFMKKEGLRRLVYKPIPYVFHSQPAQEDLYALTLNGAVLSRRDLSSALFIEGGVKYTKGKKSNIARARRCGIEIRKSTDYATFIGMLAAVLESRHGVTPAHSVAEMELLSSRFPEHIHLFGAFAGDTMLAGSVIYDNRPIIHTQYMASTPEGKTAGALDLLINVLLTETYADYRFLSFGISTINQGQTVNFGLVESKEAFGARGMVHDWYEMAVAADTGHE
jgi:hypothetical protein